MILTADDKKRIALAEQITTQHPTDFEPEFIFWLRQNWHIYIKFEKLARNIWRRGVRRYGAKCIWEVLRYNTTILEKNSEFKLNNNRSYACARLFAELNPDKRTLFKFRRRISLAGRGD